MTRRLLIIILSLLPTVAGATTFDDALAQIISNNLTARSEAARSGAAVEAILGENTLEAPEAEFSRVWGTTAEAGDKWSLSVSQSFDWPGVYAARREAARTARTAQQYLMESTLLDVRQQVCAALIDIIHNSQLLDMQTELVNRVDSLETYYRKAAEAGAETRVDYNKSVIERIATHRELHSLESDRAALIATLRTLNGGKDVDGIVAGLGTDYPIMPSPDNLTAELIRERDPSYAAARASVDAAKSMVKVEKRSRIPGFSIGYEHEVEGDETFNGFSIGLTLPVWGRRHQVKAAAFEAEAALIDAEIALARQVATMESDRVRLKALRTVIDEYEPVVNNSSNLALLHKALKAGQINFLTYIQECNYFIAARRDYLDTVYQYNLLLADLSRWQ